MGSMVPLHIFEQCKRLIVMIVGDKHVNHLSIELLTGYKALLRVMSSRSSKPC